MSDYGLPTPRDDDGNLKPVEHTYKWSGQDVTIQLVPPTISQQEEYEELGTETSTSDLREILDEHLVKPDPDEFDFTAREVLCYIEGIVDYSTGDLDGVAAEVRDELDERQGEQGN